MTARGDKKTTFHAQRSCLKILLFSIKFDIRQKLQIEKCDRVYNQRQIRAQNKKFFFNMHCFLQFEVSVVVLLYRSKLSTFYIVSSIS
ncbi:hypothetical protein T4B_764 [Trichinella pseudospiralis]|uniref:Uncharacterized protein n=1 Tax=Trichinella pseudospiralis TaxID=6337 RepID=A0A0V1IQV2_TRIPS|nr:hypothetical protein T4B_764 [Trichinella pseudospiralis]KRZ34449.1 hypothetical protein T4C_9282 [Trichinella pseudospiralis]